jgi:putative resolvase
MYSMTHGKKLLMKNMKIGEFSKLSEIPIRTLQRWDKEGKLKAYRTPTNRRYYTEEHYLLVLSWRLSNSR